ncbi:MAG: hypothetical protein GWP08_07095, partial [Nitrospiraceae bacterium]|nr:hypothetical protein [Nitrospiraceae bacterium]
MFTRRPTGRIVRFTVPLVLLLALWGCGTRTEVPADRIILEPHADGNNQCGLYDTPLDKPLRVLVEGPHEKGKLGGKGGRRPATNVEVTFTIEDPETGARFEENGGTELTALTDAAGTATA